MPMPFTLVTLTYTDVPEPASLALVGLDLLGEFKAIGADLSQADGSMHFRATKTGDLYKIEAGQERYEFPEAVLTGG